MPILNDGRHRNHSRIRTRTAPESYRRRGLLRGLRPPAAPALGYLTSVSTLNHLCAPPLALVSPVSAAAPTLSSISTDFSGNSCTGSGASPPFRVRANQMKIRTKGQRLESLLMFNVSYSMPKRERTDSYYRYGQTTPTASFTSSRCCVLRRRMRLPWQQQEGTLAAVCSPWSSGGGRSSPASVQS